MTDTTMPGAQRAGTARRDGRLWEILEAPYPAYDGLEPCATTDADLFYPPDEERGALTQQRYRLAARFCADCPVRVECATWGIAHELDGMWGGLTPKERAKIRRDRGIMLNSPTPDAWLPPVWQEGAA